MSSDDRHKACLSLIKERQNGTAVGAKHLCESAEEWQPLRSLQMICICGNNVRNKQSLELISVLPVVGLKNLVFAASLKRLASGFETLLPCLGHLFNFFPFVFILSSHRKFPKKHRTILLVQQPCFSMHVLSWTEMKWQGNLRVTALWGMTTCVGQKAESVQRASEDEFVVVVVCLLSEARKNSSKKTW